MFGLEQEPPSVGAGAVVLVAVVGLMAAPAAFANQWNERTIIEISEPVLVPGATLQPGRYVFKLLDSDSNRHVVQIFKNGDERQIITQVQAVPTKRQEAAGDTVLKFNPTATGTPALRLTSIDTSWPGRVAAIGGAIFAASFVPAGM